MLQDTATPLFSTPTPPAGLSRLEGTGAKELQVLRAAQKSSSMAGLPVATELEAGKKTTPPQT